MVFTDIQHAPKYEFRQPARPALEIADYKGKTAPTEDVCREAVFENYYIPIEGGEHTIRLLAPLKLRMNFEKMNFTVVDWGIELGFSQLGELPREIARRFLKLVSAAENEQLSEQDQAYFLQISKYIDSQQYSIQRTIAVYAEGVLTSNAQVTIVNWNTGHREKLDRKVSLALSEVNLGERFSALVKFGRDNKAVKIENVALLPEISGDEDWNSWPTKN